MVDKMALGQVFLQELPFFPVILTPTRLHAHLHLHASLIARANGRSLGALKSKAVSEIGEQWIDTCFHLFYSSKIIIFINIKRN
jgi:hypothetical protein